MGEFEIAVLVLLTAGLVFGFLAGFAAIIQAYKNWPW